MTSFIVIGPASRETGITWAPGDLEACRKMCREKGGAFFVIRVEDEGEQNPRIYNYVDPEEG